MQGLFITGTSTEVGKTHIGVLLAKALSGRNIRVIPRKPVESGCSRVDGELLPEDAQALMSAANYGGDLSAVCRYRFQPPVSPARAARLAGSTMSTANLVEVCRHGSEQGFVLVEGAGGFYSPLSEDGLNADLAAALELPVLLVAQDALGVLNQVLLNVEAIETRGLTPIGVVLNRLDAETDAQMDNAADLRERLDCAVYVQPYNASRLPGALVDAVASLHVNALA
jgi:dethiobiotin synthetase